LEYLNSAINANFISPLVVFGVMEVFLSVVVIAKPLVPKKPQNSISNLFSQLLPEKPLSKLQQKDEKCGN
jgi:uncharacterized protein YbcC (UPF0753/DUF2309 family)